MAAARIEAYHKKQLPDDAFWTDECGVELGWRWSPVATAGLYVPGGLASYPSSVLMNAIPAKVYLIYFPAIGLCLATQCVQSQMVLDSKDKHNRSYLRELYRHRLGNLSQ